MGAVLDVAAILGCVADVRQTFDCFYVFLRSFALNTMNTKPVPAGMMEVRWMGGWMDGQMSV